MNMNPEINDAALNITTCVREEILENLKKELGDHPTGMGQQHRIAAAEFVFGDKQLKLRSGIVPVRSVLQDLQIPPNISRSYTAIFNLCQSILFQDPALESIIKSFQETPDAQLIPKSMELIRREFLETAEE